jgi:hypothetical protein
MSLISNPYKSLPASAFWSSAVAKPKNGPLEHIYAKKFDLTRDDRIATAGSCFAQHIGKRLKRAAFNVMDVEPAPKGVPDEIRQAHNYGIYSARYGNIYTVRQLLQLAREVYGLQSPQEWVWKSESNRYYDALRPGVEPAGYASAEEVAFHRDHHRKKVRELFDSMDVLIFTLGLTEAWIHKSSGTVYPMVPGAIAGVFDPDVYEFKNFSYAEVLADFEEFARLMKSHATVSSKRYLITVSPVPLTATASGKHVLPATMYSKSVLRAVAGHLSDTHPTIDYFPSFEIVINPWDSRPKYEANQRSVLSSAVDEVMMVFMSQHGGADQTSERVAAPPTSENEPVDDDLICEEVLLEAFRNASA